MIGLAALNLNPGPHQHHPKLAKRASLRLPAILTQGSPGNRIVPGDDCRAVELDEYGVITPCRGGQRADSRADAAHEDQQPAEEGWTGYCIAVGRGRGVPGASLPPLAKGSGNSGQTPREYEANTKRIRRKHERTKTASRHLPAISPHPTPGQSARPGMAGRQAGISALAYLGG